MTETACDLGDVTFKSFVCAGGEVVISSASLYAEDSIILPKDQASEDTCETEDTVISESMNAQSYTDHIEHPYHNPEIRDTSSADADTASLSEVSSAVLVSEDYDDELVAQGFHVLQEDDCKEQDVTFKSFMCDGGEVEVSDVNRLPDETIPLPTMEVVDLLQCSSVNSSNFSDQLCQDDHDDHPYCSTGNDVAPLVTHLTVCETSNVLEELADGQNDVTLKSFNCTGGEIEVSDGTKPADETVPPPTDQTATSAVSSNFGINSSVLAVDQCIQNSNDRLDHPYCITENSPSSSSGNLPTDEEPSPCRLEAASEAEQSSLVVAGGHIGRQEDDSAIGAGGEVEQSEGIKLSENASLPMTGQLMHNSVHACITQDNGKQFSCLDKNEDAVVNTESSPISTLSVASLKEVEDDCINGQSEETSKKDSVRPEDGVLPFALHKPESADCSLTASANTPIPTEVQRHPRCDAEVPSNTAAFESCGTKGSCGDEPVLCDKKPHEGNFADVLKGLIELPSVAKALQSEILSPVYKRASPSGLKACKDSALRQFLGDDFALEGTNNVDNLEANGLWTGAFESPMPRPLFNSTELVARYSNKPLPDRVTEPVEGMGATPRAVPQAQVEKPFLNIPVIGDGPLQQQLRQMAEFLILASGKMATTAVSAPASTPAPAKPTPAESHNACVGTSPVKLVDHSLNTSGKFERVRDFSLVDACTVTEPLLWK